MHRFTQISMRRLGALRLAPTAIALIGLLLAACQKGNGAPGY